LGMIPSMQSVTSDTPTSVRLPNDLHEGGVT
jgi:hypothetical protein